MVTTTAILGQEADPDWARRHRLFVGTGFSRKLVAWLIPRLKQLEVDKSSFAGKVPYKSGRKIHWAHPQLIAGIEHTSWTNDGVLRQASCKSVYERNDRTLRPDWINLPGDAGE